MRNNTKGFSLIELCMCLLICGLMAGIAATTSQSMQTQRCIASTQDQLQILNSALQAYAKSNRRYPRPAGLGIGLLEPGYGSEVTTPIDVHISRVGAGANLVLVGALPHAGLAVESSMASDCWGNKFTYAVTASYTETATYADPNLQGVITVKRGTLAAAQTVSDSIGYVIISHGPDALGASQAAYSGPIRHCDSVASDASQTRIDKENCDTLNSVYFDSEFNAGTNASLFFDDLLAMGGNPALPPDACASGLVSWGTFCSAPALLTLGGLSVNVTNTAAGYTGLAVSSCTSGVRSTLGVCLPIGACPATNPRTGDPMVLLTGIGINFGSGVCKKYACCNGAVSITDLSPCLLPLDLPGIAISCP